MPVQSLQVYLWNFQVAKHVEASQEGCIFNIEYNGRPPYLGLFPQWALSVLVASSQEVFWGGKSNTFKEVWCLRGWEQGERVPTNSRKLFIQTRSQTDSFNQLSTPFLLEDPLKWTHYVQYVSIFGKSLTWVLCKTTAQTYSHIRSCESS